MAYRIIKRQVFNNDPFEYNGIFYVVQFPWFNYVKGVGSSILWMDFHGLYSSLEAAKNAIVVMNRNRNNVDEVVYEE